MATVKVFLFGINKIIHSKKRQFRQYLLVRPRINPIHILDDIINQLNKLQKVAQIILSFQNIQIVQKLYLTVQIAFELNLVALKIVELY
jgi:hypothetical protein